MTILVTVYNESGEDGFFWLWDQMKYGSPAILSGERINSHQQKQVTLECDSDDNGRVTWSVQNASSGTTTSRQDVEVSSNDILSIDVPFRSASPSVFRALPLTLSVTDPETLALIQGLYSKTQLSKDSQFTFLGVNEIKITGGEAHLDMESISTAPNRIEENIISYANHNSEKRIYDKIEEIITREIVTFETTKGTTSSTESSFKLSLPGKFNVSTEMSQKLSFSYSEKATQQLATEKKITRKIYVEVPPHTLWEYKVIVEKGVVSGRIIGMVCLDAEIKVSFLSKSHLMKEPVVARVWLSHNKLLPRDIDRLVDYAGVISAETYSRDQIIDRSTPLDPSNPLSELAEVLNGDGGWTGMG